MSHLTRGAWIEIPVVQCIRFQSLSGRTSHEVRGLKYRRTTSAILIYGSHLTRGAWIEISRAISPYKMDSGRTSHEVRGLKYGYGGKAHVGTKSHLTRGAWIEISASGLLIL